jgi:hypothetical protein
MTPAQPSERRCVVTVLVGGYEELVEQPVRSSSALDFVCLTDDPELESATWEIRRIRPILPADPVRSAREVKIRLHRHLDDYDTSLYIDNAVLLLRAPEDVLDALLPPGCPMALPEHSFRSTVRAEFDVVGHGRLDARHRLAEQLAAHREHDPDALELRPCWAGIIARRHHEVAVVDAMERWYAEVLRYSRRDQLSLHSALRAAGLTPIVHQLDNHESPFHRWPVAIGRREELRRERWTPEDVQLGQLESRLDAIERSRTWRWAQPIRAASIRARRAAGRPG